MQDVVHYMLILANPICVGKVFWVHSSSNCIGERNELNLRSLLRSSVFIEMFMPRLIGLVFLRCKFDCRHFTVHTHPYMLNIQYRDYDEAIPLHRRESRDTLSVNTCTSIHFHLHPRSLSLSLFPHCPNKSPSPLSFVLSLMFRQYRSRGRF